MDKLLCDKRTRNININKKEETLTKARKNYVVTRSMVFTMVVIEQFLLSCLIFCQCHCVKYRNFTEFPGTEILWKGTVSAEFRATLRKLCLSAKLPQ